MRPTTIAAVALIATAALLLGACSDDDAEKKSDSNDHSRVTKKAPSDTVQVGLIEYTVTADKPSVKAGAIKFEARNTSQSQVHELAVLLVKPDGSTENTGEIEDIAPGKSGTVVLDLPAGKYELACLIAPGEAGSQTDHYKQGMKVAFEVK
jgi:iron uptake system component EfeO